MSAPARQARLVALIGLALLLFSPPLVVIVDRPAAGLSWLPLYLFMVWLVVIGLAAWLLEQHGEDG